MLAFIIVALVSLMGYFFSVVVVAEAAIAADDYKQMIHQVRSSVFAMCVVVALSFFLFGSTASIFLAFCIAHAVALCRIDYEAAYKIFKGL